MKGRLFARLRPLLRPSRRVRSIGRFALLALVLGLLGWAMSQVEWRSVGHAIAAYSARTLGMALAFALAGHLFYSLYDRLGMAWSRHRLPAAEVMQVSFASYTFNLNLGPVVGALAFRFRMYAGMGLSNEAIVRVLAFSLTTNWLGYALLGGGVLLGGFVPLPEAWAVGTPWLRALGLLLWLAVLAYLAACGLSKRRSFHIKGRQIALPGLRMALLQLLISCSHWLATAGVLWALLRTHASYPEVLCIFLMAAIAGAITHIPAGIGVLEAVFVALLSHRTGRPDIIAALLAYRSVYYLLPLGLAVAIYLRAEARTATAASS